VEHKRCDASRSFIARHRLQSMAFACIAQRQTAHRKRIAHIGASRAVNSARPRPRPPRGQNDRSSQTTRHHSCCVAA